MYAYGVKVRHIRDVEGDLSIKATCLVILAGVVMLVGVSGVFAVGVRRSFLAIFFIEVYTAENVRGLDKGEREMGRRGTSHVRTESQP